MHLSSNIFVFDLPSIVLKVAMVKLSIVPGCELALLHSK